MSFVITHHGIESHGATFLSHLKTHTLWDLDSGCSLRAGVSPSKVQRQNCLCLLKRRRRDPFSTKEQYQNQIRPFLGSSGWNWLMTWSRFPEWKPWFFPDTIPLFPCNSELRWQWYGQCSGGRRQGKQCPSLILKLFYITVLVLCPRGPGSCMLLACRFFWPGQFQTVSSEYQGTKKECWLVLTQQVNV